VSGIDEGSKAGIEIARERDGDVRGPERRDHVEPGSLKVANAVDGEFGERSR
jgi:hypothetical protein